MEMMAIAVIALVAFAVVLIPLLRRGTASRADAREFATGEVDDVAHDADVVEPAPARMAVSATATNAELGSDDAIEREVMRYRAALRAGTLCTRCGQANPADSVFCSDCGRKLPLADAKEFE